MEYTENLNLPVLEDTDTMINIFTQGNALASQLENLFGANYSDYQNLSNITTEITSLNNDVTTLGLRCDELESGVNSASARITQISNGKMKLTTTDGVEISGTVTRYVLTATAIGSRDSVEIGDYKLTKINGQITINATTVFNITNTSGITILNTSIYDSDIAIGVNADIDPRFIFSGFKRNPNTLETLMVFNAENIFLTPLQVSVTGSYDNRDYVMVIDIFREDVE